jgi:sugar phosphate isomerase/epimerase
MKFGMPTLIELESFEQNVSLCRKLDLSFIEINMNMPLFQISGLKDLRTPSDIELTLHLPEEINVWDFNDIIRDAWLKIMGETIETARDKNIKILNMHMNRGVYFTLPEQKIYLFGKYKTKYLDNNIRFAEKVSRMLGKNPEITVCIENTGIYDNGFIIEALQQLLAYDCFKLTWDTGHDYSSGNKDTSFIKGHCDKLRHLHLHDAIGSQNHLPLGSGNLDIGEILDEVKTFVERIVLETKTVLGLEESVEYLKKRSIDKDKR